MNRKIVQSVFEATAAAFPERVAVEEENGRKVTYRELNRRADELAVVLRARGVVAGTVTGIFLPEGAGTVTVMLAVLKAGGIFMPLGTTLPDRRLTDLVRFADPVLVITDMAHEARLRHGSDGASPILEEAQPSLLVTEEGALEDTVPPSEIDAGELSARWDPEDGCYLLFTSGSTGEPKAILGRQKSLSHFIHWEMKEFGLDEGARVSLLAPVTFDVSLRDMFVPLLAGGTLCIPDAETKKNARRLLSWLDDARVNTVHCVPSLFRLLTQEIRLQGISDPLLHLRRILLAGEALYQADVHRWRDVAGDRIELVNLYGPSETTLAKLFHRIGADGSDAEGIVPLGQPIANTAALILKDGALCRVGEVGEIHIKTPFLSLGYYKRPDLTADRFVQNPLNPDSEDIIYRTGDLGRYLPDRSVEFAGRLDFQVKIHGNRVELGEIENALLTLSGIDQAVVLALESEDHVYQLAAFYTAADEIEVSRISAHLAGRLPEYMIPGRFTRVDRFPLNAHGKVDRARLETEDRERSRERDFEPPSTETEAALADIWADVLELERVGALDPFFEIGGHSLNAIRIISRIYSRFGIEISIRDFFDRPVISELASFIDGAEKTGTQAIQPVPEREDGYELSPAQRRLWMLDHLDPGSVAYTIHTSLVLEGSLDVDALRHAWQALVERHESLRTVYRSTGDGPRQFVRENDFDLTWIDYSGEPSPDKTAERYAREEFVRPFDLSTGPLLRVPIIRLADDRHLMLVNVHHIVCDAWSLDTIARELRVLYEAELAGTKPDLPLLAIQYRDYAAWRNAALQSDRIKATRDYWLEKMAGEIQPLDLPTDAPRPPMKTFAGNTLRFLLPEDVRDAIRALGAEFSASAFVTTLALLKVLLHRYTGQEDIVVGTTIANRNLPELENQVGFYVDTLALRDRIETGAAFRDVLEAVKQTTADAFHHEAYPFDSLVDELNLLRDVSRNPLFDVALVYHADRVGELKLGSLHIRELHLSAEESKYDLLFVLNETADGLELRINYNTDLFREETVQRLKTHLEQLARSAVEKPDVDIGELDLLSGAEKKTLLSDFKGETVPDTLKTTLVDLFDRQVQAGRDRPAVSSGSETLTYGELDRRTNRIARHLVHELGVQKGDAVGVFCGRTAGTVIGMIAAMKAGGAYLPIDPDLPAERIAAQFEKSGCRVVIVGGEGDFPQGVGAKVVRLDEIAGGDDTRPDVDVQPDDLAYIIFTSGTTGTPKGVMVEHGGFANMSLAQIRMWDVRVTDHVLQFANVSFDASLSEYFMALLSGAKLVLTPREIIHDPDAFADFVKRERITVATLPPVYLAMLGRRDLAPLRTLITAGEAAIRRDTLHYARTLTCWNAYGPSESSVCATCFPVDPGRDYPGSIPIGRPIPNMEMLVLDPGGRLAPIGVPGELCIAGPGLARGYIGEEELTDRAFRPHPFREGERIYRTGDRGRWLADGNLEFLGRTDDQVKIRGHRIEPGEVEAVLRAHPGIGEAHVYPVGEGTGRELVAWYQPSSSLELWPSVAEFYVYDDVLYRAMFTDEPRNEQYKAAFRAALPGKTVLEIGPGPEAILSRFAVEAGAKKVYAVELLEETYEKAKARVAELGLEDRIELIQGNLLELELPEKVDYCISEIVGAIGGSEGAAKIINHARRFLKDPSHMIPERSLTRIAAVTLPEGPNELYIPEISGHYIEQIFDQVGYPFDLRLCLKNFAEERLLTDDGALEDLDYTSEIPLETDHEVHLNVLKDGLFHGLLAWLHLFTDAEHEVDILERRGSWLPVYLPISNEGVPVRRGDTLQLTISRRLCDNELNPDYIIDGRVERSGEAVFTFLYDAFHFRSEFRRNPFYRALFAADGSVETVPDVSASGLRRFLGGRLPDYMIPSRFVPVETFPMTPNGKVDRDALPQPQEAALSEERTPVEPRNDREATIAKAVAEITGSGTVGVRDDLFTFGMDSIKAIQLVARLKQADLRLEVRDIFQNPTVEQLAEIAREVSRRSDQGRVAGEVVPTPIQRWFHETHTRAPHHFNQSMALRTDVHLDETALRTALQAMLDHHDVLRMRVARQNGRVMQEISEDAVLPFETVDLRRVDDPAEILAEHAAGVQNGFNLEQGPLLRAALYRMPNGDRLLITAHHLVVDGVSWRILLEDLETAYGQAVRGGNVQLPAKTDSFKAWSEAVAEAAGDGRFRSEEAWWRGVVEATVPELPREIENGVTAHRRDTDRIEVELAAEATTALLTRAHTRYRTEINDLLLTALARAMKEWHGGDRTLLSLEGHGREPLFGELDVSRTVGWFTSLYPVLLDLGGETEPGAQIKTIKEGLRAVPNKGVGYGVLRYLKEDDRKAFPVHRRPEVSFNYLGQVGDASGESLFKPAVEEAGPEISPDSELEADLSFVAVTAEGRLRVSLAYNRNHFTRATMQRLANDFIAQLAAVIRHCSEDAESELTPSDIGYDGFSMKDLDDFLDDFDVGE